MLWVINGLIYGFFTAIYMLFNQHYKINGYILGIWRGFGICILFLPCLLFYPLPTTPYYWLMLILQGLCIGIYDSHIFFASAKFGAGPTSRFMSVVVLLTTFAWWLITPQQFIGLLSQGNLLITLILILCGFSFCYWQMLDSYISRAAAIYTLPAVLALAAMSIITKYLAVEAHSLGQGLSYYLTVATFISGLYNLILYRRQATKIRRIKAPQPLFSKQMLRPIILLVGFSSMLIVAKTMALRIAPNPGYVTALLLIAPLFIYALNRNYKIADNISVKAGFAMIFFLVLLVFLVNGNFGVDE
ncbi:MAG: hypothetical protein IKN71_04395 [Alphaproteobacteria bacterium]|nr:hypothetical protein [Alphaproteobacteria bacterium]